MKRTPFPSRSGLHSQLPNPPTLIEHRNMRFLIMDTPSESNLHLYLKEMERYGVVHLVRVCEPTYGKEPVEQKGITVHDWVFPDGEAPPTVVVHNWLALVNQVFNGSISSASAYTNSDGPSAAIAVHCIAGLGRAPVLVALALVESGMEALESVEFIRQKRRGAINLNQLKFLEFYSHKKKSSGKCTIM